LLQRGHRVRALVRAQSAAKLPAGCTPVVGDALDGGSYRRQVAPADTFVHLVGVSRPNPLKADQFRRIDLASVEAAAQAAASAGVRHFVYVSVAHPAPVMKTYVAVRQACEELIAANDLNATILRPWYILGPGHWWPYALVPLYAICERLPPTAETARRLGLVKLPQMVAALLAAVENPAEGTHIVEVPQIRQAALPR
jgi:uncharacterized protein YbjT (DUF2867 family)